SAARRLIRFGYIDWILVISPRTLIANWMSETLRWAPELTVATAIPSNQDRSRFWARIVRRAHILFTSYEQIRKPAEALIRNPPGLIIADEAHRLRNYSSLSTQGIRLILSNRFWALTGTPIERDTEDLAVLLSLLDPARFSIDDKNSSPMSLRARLRPYLLRRRKETIMSNHPRVIEENEVLELTEEQRESYRAAIIEYRSSASKVSILPLFNSLRTICDYDPKTGRSSKLDRIIELISDIVLSDEKVVIFSYILEPLNLLVKKIKECNPKLDFTSISGSMSLKVREEVINEFKTNPKCYILLASTRVASEGLTLTEANNVIFINRWWNPSSNLQARDRVVRIGQSRLVNVKSFTCKDTVEERLDHLLKTKSLTFDQIVQSLSTTSADSNSAMNVILG
ncbi:MAG: DEAD/DEAH box helicase, partial [Gammaproteobacteria bacterium]|nr:DEAD/DEAH box helicase [Gammaproteobacteria bacterium]